MTAWKGQWKAESQLIVRSLVTALVICSVIYGERHLERAFEPWPWWLQLLGMTVVLSVALWLVMRSGQRQPVALRPPPEDGQRSWTAARSSFSLLQGKTAAVVQTLEGTAKGRLRRNALPAWPRYLLIGASASGKTGLLEGLARLVPPTTRPPAHPGKPTSECNWWLFQTAAILDTCGRYTSSIPQTQDHDEWCDVLEFLRSAQVRQPLNGILLTVAADALGVQPLELIRRDALAARQRLHEARQVLGRDIPLYIVVTRCDLIEGFVGFFAQLPEYIRTQVFGWIDTARRPRKQRQHHPAGTLPETHTAAMLTRRLDQLRLFALNDALRTGRSRQQLFCFPEEFRALQRRLRLFLDTLCIFDVPLDAPYVRGVFFGSAQQQGTPFSALRDTLGFKTPPLALEESTESYFLHDLLTVILPRDRHLARPTTRR